MVKCRTKILVVESLQIKPNISRFVMHCALPHSYIILITTVFKQGRQISLPNSIKEVLHAHLLLGDLQMHKGQGRRFVLSQWSRSLFSVNSTLYFHN